MTTPPRSKAASSWLMTFPSHGVSRASLLQVFGLASGVLLRATTSYFIPMGMTVWSSRSSISTTFTIICQKPTRKVSARQNGDIDDLELCELSNKQKLLHWKYTWNAWTAKCFWLNFELFNMFFGVKGYKFQSETIASTPRPKPSCKLSEPNSYSNSNKYMQAVSVNFGDCQLSLIVLSSLRVALQFSWSGFHQDHNPCIFKDELHIILVIFKQISLKLRRVGRKKQQ